MKTLTALAPAISAYAAQKVTKECFGLNVEQAAKTAFQGAAVKGWSFFRNNLSFITIKEYL